MTPVAPVCSHPSLPSCQGTLTPAIPEFFSVWETPFSAHFRRSTPDGRRCRGPKGRGSRCEAARAAIRFGGQVREDVLKCTIAPRFGRKGDPSSPSFSLAYPPLPFFFPSSPFQPAARGPKGAVALSRWPTIGYFFTLLLTMISHSPSTGTVSGARQGTVHLSAIGVLHYIV
jgi:hypothetical protein